MIINLSDPDFISLPSHIYRADDVRYGEELAEQPKFTINFITKAHKYLERRGTAGTLSSPREIFGWKTHATIAALYTLANRGYKVGKSHIDYVKINPRGTPVKFILDVERSDVWFQRKLGLGLFELGLVTFGRSNNTEPENSFWTSTFDDIVKKETKWRQHVVGIDESTIFEDLTGSFPVLYNALREANVRDYVEIARNFLRDQLTKGPLGKAFPFSVPKTIECTTCGRDAILMRRRFGAYYRCACRRTFPMYANVSDCKCGGKRQVRVARAAKYINVCSEYPRCPYGVEIFKP